MIVFVRRFKWSAGLSAGSALAGLLAGCGGASGGTVASTPVPVTHQGPFPLVQNAEFAATTGYLAYTGHIGDGIGTRNTAQLDSAGIQGRSTTTTFGFNSVTGTYTVTDGIGTASFTAADRVAASGYSDQYAKQSAGRSDSLTVYGNLRSGIGGTPPVSLSYSSFAQWSSTELVPERSRTVYFTFGQPTGDAMPRSGSASYATTVRTTSLSAAPVSVQPQTGQATFSANFGAGTVATTLQLSYPNATYNGTGTISSDMFDGAFTSTSPSFAFGRFLGSFYGPNAAEMGYTFIINHHLDPYEGAAVGPSLLELTGVVAGAKN